MNAGAARRYGDIATGRPSPRRRAPDPFPADDLDGEPDPDARAFYYERVRAALDRLDTTDPPDPKEIGGTPLPVAIEGLTLSAPWTPVAT